MKGKLLFFILNSKKKKKNKQTNKPLDYWPYFLLKSFDLDSPFQNMQPISSCKIEENKYKLEIT